MLVGDGEPRGEGSGEGGAAPFEVLITGGGAALAFFLGGGVCMATSCDDSSSSTMPSFEYARLRVYCSTASPSPIDCTEPPCSFCLSIRHPLPPTTCSSASASSASSSRNVASAPFGNTSGNCLSVGGSLKLCNGY